MRHQVILPLVMAILGFLTIPWLGPKDREPRAPSVPKAKLGHTKPRVTSVLYVSRLVRYWFSHFFKLTAFLVPSVEPVFVGIHDFLNLPPWIHMIDYRYFIPGVGNSL